MRASFNILGTAVATLGCAFILQSCSDTAPVDQDNFSAAGSYQAPSEADLAAAAAQSQHFLGKTATLCEESLMTNGGFEENGGSFDGWTVYNQDGGNGDYYIQSGTSSPVSGFAVPEPPEGTYAAMSDQGGPGTHIIYQDVTIPNGGATLSFELFIGNRAGAWYHPTTLSFSNGSNQQFRVDIMDTDADVDDYGTGILQNIYTTDGDDDFVSGYNTISVSIDEFDGETVRIRFAEVDNQFFFQAGVDNVCLIQNAIEVGLDVKPGSSTNPINIGAGGKIPVAILGSDELDVTSIDVSSILLGDGSGSGTGVAVRNNGSLHYSIEDVDGDGDMDLMMHFSVSAMVANGDLSSTSTSLTVSGMNNDEEAITGEDDITIVP